MGTVYVAGSMNMDVVAFGPKLPAPGETILGDRVGFFPGGKGLNPAAAAAKQGADAQLLACLGDDSFGEQLHDFAEASGIDVSRVRRVQDTHSGTAIILVSADGENSISVIPGSNAQLAPEDVSAPNYRAGDVLLTLFEIPLPTVEAFLRAGRAAGATTILSPSPAADFDFRGLPDILVLNETELAFYLGRPVKETEIAEAASSFRASEEQTVVVTLGREGALALQGARQIRVPGREVEAVDTTGAGDCFVGSLAARLAAGDELDVALRYANAAAAICVTRPGAAPSMPQEDEVRELLLSL